MNTRALDEAVRRFPWLLRDWTARLDDRTLAAIRLEYRLIVGEAHSEENGSA